MKKMENVCKSILACVVVYVYVLKKKCNLLLVCDGIYVKYVNECLWTCIVDNYYV